MGFFNFNKTKVTTNAPDEDNKSIKGIVHHILDWTFNQGLEARKTQQKLLDEIDKKQDELDCTIEELAEIKEQLKELTEKSKKKKIKPKK